MEASFGNTLQMYCNNSADRTIVKQNHGPGTLSDRRRVPNRGYLIGQGRVPYRTGAGTLSDKSDRSDRSDKSDGPSQPPQLAPI